MTFRLTSQFWGYFAFVKSSSCEWKKLYCKLQNKWDFVFIAYRMQASTAKAGSSSGSSTVKKYYSKNMLALN